MADKDPPSLTPPEDYTLVVASRFPLLRGCPKGGVLLRVGEDIDPTYRLIDWAWIADGPYGVVHRIASSGEVKGAGAFCLDWAFEQCRHLRVDTHEDNIVMRNLLTKLGFEYCGIIYVLKDNSPRMAFEKI